MHRTIFLLTILFLLNSAAAQETTLRPGDTLQGSLATGDTLNYVFEVTEDSYVLGYVNQISVDVEVRILKPDGEALRSFDGPIRGREQFSFETDAEGQYTLEVSPVEEETGDFMITLERLEPVETDPAKLADQLMARYDRGDTPGGVISVFRDGNTIFSRAYGMANLSYDIPFAVDTRTNIGSTSKQFTAFAIMLLAEDGKLSLDDDIREHIPELPDFGETITVRHIITHTSGLREFLNILIMSGRRLDHGDFIDRKELIRIVQRQPALQNSPGAEWNYNNTAFGLAAVIVERISGQPFHEFMQDNVFTPLQMTRSMVRPSPEHIVRHRSDGYLPRPDGTYVEVADLGGAVGAGGIYSTVADLQKWVENFSDPKIGSPEIFEQMMTSYILTDGEPTRYGFGLTIDEQGGLKRVQHGGADVAHRSMLAYYPEINAGITTQSNNASFDGSIAFRLAEAFFAEDMELTVEEAIDGAEAEFDPATYDAESFDEMVGRYALDAMPGFILTFTRDGDRLYAQATGQAQFEITPSSESTFSITVVDASIEFHRNDEGQVDSLTLNQGGKQRATRLDTELWVPTATDLTEFIGRYYSDEIETFYNFTLEQDKLTLHQMRMDDAELSPGEADSFSGGGFSFSFERDRNQKLIAFYLSNGRTQGVRFARQSQ